MKFPELIELVADQPVFHTSFLLAGEVDPADVRRQLSRWTRAGKVHMLRRGVYALAPPYRRRMPHAFVIANHLVEPSYVSTHSALAFAGLIPEHVPVVTSVTTRRALEVDTALGRFSFRHVQPTVWRGYRAVSLPDQQEALVAWPEKALLDLVYLEPGGDAPGYLRALRLQGLARLDTARLTALAAGRPKLLRAARTIAELSAEDEA